MFKFFIVFFVFFIFISETIIIFGKIFRIEWLQLGVYQMLILTTEINTHVSDMGIGIQKSSTFYQTAGVVVFSAM